MLLLPVVAVVEMEFHYISQAGFQFMTTLFPQVSASLVLELKVHTITLSLVTLMLVLKYSSDYEYSFSFTVIM